MFCTQCGTQNPDDARFCQKCGTPLEQEDTLGQQPQAGGAEGDQPQQDTDQGQQGGYQPQQDTDQSQQSRYQSQQNAYQGGQTDPEKKVDIKELLTAQNIERYAPLAVFFPVILSILLKVFGLFAFLKVIYRVIIFLLKSVFTVATLGSAGGLFYVAATEKKKENVWTWIAPGAAGLAVIACISLVFHWKAVSVILCLICLALGLDFLARITISGCGMDTPIDPAADIAVYQEFIKKYKEEHPSTKQMEKSGYTNPNDSYFDGSGAELLGLTILTALVSTVTCGIAAPWMICKTYKWRIEHTVVNGKRFTFNGNGASLLGHWILWELLTVVTCGIYGFFTYVQLQKWEASHTFIDGEPIVPGEETSYFDGNGAEYLGYGLLGGLINLFTCSIGMPWVTCMLQGWVSKHTVINGRRLKFTGTGLGFLGEYLIIALLSLVTCGIYSSWGVVRMNKYITSHTDFEN